MNCSMHLFFLPSAGASAKPTDSDSKWQIMYYIVPVMTLSMAVAVAAAVMTIVMIGELDMVNINFIRLYPVIF